MMTMNAYSNLFRARIVWLADSYRNAYGWHAGVELDSEMSWAADQRAAGAPVSQMQLTEMAALMQYLLSGRYDEPSCGESWLLAMFDGDADAARAWVRRAERMERENAERTIP